MSRHEQLKAVLQEIGGSSGTIETLEECPTSDFVLRTPCYVAFFVVIEHAEALIDVWKEAQSEIVRVQSARGSEWPRDLNLVLLVASGTQLNVSSVRAIVDDRHVCKKFVLYANGEDIRNVLTDLPFGPSGELFGEAPTSVDAGVQGMVRGSDPRLLGDLASYSPGAERVYEKIIEGLYDLTNSPLARTTSPLLRVAPSMRTHLEAIDITYFRGIRRLQAKDLPLSGDVVIIYGPNGVGKTSIADAIEWAITGHVDRLEQRTSGSTRTSHDPIINVFSEGGEARVVCHLSNRDPISRLKRGRTTDLRIGSRSVTDNRAIIDHVVGTKAPSQEAKLRIERLRSLFRSSHMLSQHDIRQFLERTKPDERFDILTNMIGADEFVRFREKVTSVLGHLQSYIKKEVADNTLIARELEDISKRLHERTKDRERQGQAVTAGRTSADVHAELLLGLRNCQCAIDEDVIERIDAESEESGLELTAAHAKTVIQTKKATLEDLLVRLKSLKQELPGYDESRTLCVNLAAEIGRAKSASENARIDLMIQEKVRQDSLAHLEDLKSKQAGVARQYSDLAWLKNILPSYYRNQEILLKTEESLAHQRHELRRYGIALEDHQESLRLLQTQLQEIEETISTRATREHALVALLERLPQVQTRRQEGDQLSQKERTLDFQRDELKQQADRARREEDTARARLEQVQREYDSEAAHNDVLSEFLARLAQLVQTAECPLCGRNYATPEEAIDSIREHLSTVPFQLKNLARQLDEVKRDIEHKRMDADAIAARIQVVDSKLEEVRSSKTFTIEAVQDFLVECTGLNVKLPEQNPASWQTALVDAREECSVASLKIEASTLRESMKLLAARVTEQQNCLDVLQHKIAEGDKQRSRLTEEIQETERDMVQKGIGPTSLPNDNKLAAQLSKTQDEARVYGELVTKKETELEALQATCVRLQQDLRRTSEDVSSKENQLRQYETICNRFVAACNAVGVDPDNPKDSIRLAEQKASELDVALSTLDEKRQILQQVAGLGRLNLEIEDLARAAEEVKRRSDASAQEESRLHDWMSHMKGLEAKVIKEQVDVVGSHLERLGPTMQRLYNRLSPHPIFGEIRIRVNEKTRELDVLAKATLIRERLGDVAVSPPAFFSDAQMNSLAITVFLGGALRQRWSGFNTILIDDPIQQLDEMNVFAFLDLIRGLSSHKQFIIFTCSRDFYLLALEKLECLNKSKRGSFLAHRLEGIAPAQLQVHCDAV